MLHRAALIAVCLVLNIGLAHAEQVFTFYGVADWRALPLALRAAYIAGAVDGSSYVGALANGGLKGRAQDIGTCLTSNHVTDAQIAKDLETFISNHPSYQTGTTFNALAAYLAELCPVSNG